MCRTLLANIGTSSAILRVGARALPVTQASASCAINSGASVGDAIAPVVAGATRALHGAGHRDGGLLFEDG